jgi:hypothetical protein
MARQIIDIGTQGNDGTGDSIRESFRKVNDNFTQLFAIFGDGDRIAFTDLDDTPDSYLPDQVIVSNADGDALVGKNLIGGDGILVDNTDPNQIRVIAPMHPRIQVIDCDIIAQVHAPQIRFKPAHSKLLNTLSTCII